MSNKPYNGSQRQLVLAFDVGTTFSGISYTIMTPGEIPKISGVNRFPAQENVGGDSKIPSIIYYDKAGVPRSFGAEALDPRNIELAEEEEWTKVEWFKLHLRPKSMETSIDGTQIPALPAKKTIVEVFADFMSYLLRCARTYITETHAAGDILWQSIETKIHFVLTHPNGWTGPQQVRMRKSAILANLVPDTPEGRSRIQFVTEGEASLHFCVNSGLAENLIKPGNQVIIADAGGGTIDISSYRFNNVEPLKIEESSVPECKAQGSVFVSRRAHQYLQGHLSGSKYGSPEDIDAIAEVFDKTTKRIFRDQDEPAYIKFAAPKDKDIKFNIRNGQLKLAGTVVAGFFYKSIESIIDIIKEQEKTKNSPTAVFLVGGFAASPWLFSQLQKHLAGSSFSVCRPDSHTNKAVADGAIYFYLDHVVTERIARTTLGCRASDQYNSKRADHRKRYSSTFVDIAGHRRIPEGFSVILKKDTKVSDTSEFRRPYYRVSADQQSLISVEVSILSFNGNSKTPEWVDQQPELFSPYCHVSADLLELVESSAQHRSLTGQLYHRIDYEIIILFGLTETKAQVAWKINGIEKRSPATIVYGDGDLLSDEVEEEDEPELPLAESVTDSKNAPLIEDDTVKTEVDSKSCVKSILVDEALADAKKAIVLDDAKTKSSADKKGLKSEFSSDPQKILTKDEDDWELA